MEDQRLGPGADVIPVGAGLRLVSTVSLAKEFGISERGAASFLDALGVPMVRPAEAGRSYFSMGTLELKLWGALRPPEVALTHLDELEKLAEIYGTTERAEILKRMGEAAEVLRKAMDVPRKKSGAGRERARRTRTG